MARFCSRGIPVGLVHVAWKPQLVIQVSVVYKPSLPTKQLTAVK